tara:strand:- start:197 stop:424 length:228 start_codon:yes stop_codon:yes gene_type:complete
MIEVKDKEEIMAVIYSGHMVVSKNNTSLCNLEDHMMGNFAPRKKYQVWSDRFKVYDLYHDLGEATDRFLKLSNKR